MKVSAHFHLQEFLPPDIYTQFGDVAIQFLDPRIINLAEFYRSYFGKPVMINTWDSGGTLKERGFRHPMSQTGGKLSQHKFGRAFDCNIEGMTSRELYRAIIDHAALFISKGLTTLENVAETPSWLHSDCRNVQGYLNMPTKFDNGILIVNP